MSSPAPAPPDYEAIRSANAARTVDATMMDLPLRVTDIMRRAEQLFPEREIVSRLAPGVIERSSYAEVGEKARRLGAALQGLGVKPGARVATLMWNHATHLACYYAAPAVGAVLHTLNPRLSPEELAYVVADAGDEVLILDEDLLPLWREVERYVTVPHVIVNGAPGAATDKPLAELLTHAPLPAWPEGELDERSAAAICYTSGTTGRPKGVVYSHRSMVLHVLGISLPDVFAIAGDSVAMPVTPMFHVNAWGIPFAAAMMGAKQVLPGPRCSAEEMLALMESEGVSIAFGVPTIWSMVLQALEAEPERWQLEPGLQLCSAGSMPPPEMIRRFDRFGLTMRTGWGMTETSPIASKVWIKPEYQRLGYEDQLALRCSNGLPLPLVEMRVVDEEGRSLPWDGSSRGELQVRGPWIADGYLGRAQEAVSEDGWLRTGDIALIQPDGYLRLVDRLKDLIKSGGEWISSVDMENAIVELGDVTEAAVIAIADSHWGERPLAVVCARPGSGIDAEAVREHLLARYPRWMVPERIELVEEIPKTGIGKLNKVALRQLYGQS